jgi:hypothetical protein
MIGWILIGWISHTPTVRESILDDRFVYFDHVYVPYPRFSGELQQELEVSAADRVSPTCCGDYLVSRQHPWFRFQKHGLESLIC